MLAIACLVTSSLADSGAQYPAYIWSQRIRGEKTEVTPESDAEKVVTSSNVSDEIKNILDTTEAHSFIVYYRPGMTTQQLAKTLVDNKKIGTLLRESSQKALERSFTDVTGAPLVEGVQAHFNHTKYVVVDSKESLANLRKEIETAATPFSNMYYVIEIPAANDAAFDEIVYQAERTFSVRTQGGHVSILAGGKINKRLLQEVDVDPTDDDTETEENAENTDFLTSGILTQILVAIPLLFLLLGAVMQLFAIKTPTLFVDRGIDFGRIEK